MLAFGPAAARGYAPYSQLLPNNPTAPAFTWHADADGRIALDRIRFSEAAKDAWQFNRYTVANLPQMYAAAQRAVPDARYVRLGLVIPPLQADGSAPPPRRSGPPTVPDRLGSPQAGSCGHSSGRWTPPIPATNVFTDGCSTAWTSARFRTPTGAPSERLQAGKLRSDPASRCRLDIAGIPDAWDAAPQLLADARGLKVDLVRQKDGCWRFTESTVSRIPELFAKLTAKERADRERSGQFDSARDTVVTLIDATHRDEYARAARCLDLSDYLPGAQAEIGRVLAYKFKYVLDRTGRVYIQEVPDDPDGARYSLFRGPLGRIVLGKKADGPRKNAWLFTSETVDQIESMYRAVADRPPDPSLADVPEAQRRADFLGGARPVAAAAHASRSAQMPLGPFDAFTSGPA